MQAHSESATNPWAVISAIGVIATGLWVGGKAVFHFGLWVKSVDARMARIERHLGIPEGDA